jgi:hypothetical protein
MRYTYFSVKSCTGFFSFLCALMARQLFFYNSYWTGFFTSTVNLALQLLKRVRAEQRRV